MRVLILIDRHADYQAAQSVALLARRMPREISIEARTIGRGGDFRNAAEAILALRGRRKNRWDLIHAWGRSPLRLALFTTRRGEVPLVYTPGEEITDAKTRCLGKMSDRRRMRVICPSSACRRLCIRRGLPAEDCEVIPPGVDQGDPFYLLSPSPGTPGEGWGGGFPGCLAQKRLPRGVEITRDTPPAASQSRDRLRSALGFAPTDVVLLAPGTTSRLSGHRQAVWTAAILNVLDAKHKLLLWGRGPLALHVKRFGDQQGSTDLVRLATRHLSNDVQFAEILPAADLVLDASHDPLTTLPVQQCMAAGLSIVTAGISAGAELLSDRRTALFAEGRAPRLLATRLLELVRDPALQRELAQAAREEALQRFTAEDFTRRHAAVYQRLLGSGDAGHVAQVSNLAV